MACHGRGAATSLTTPDVRCSVLGLSGPRPSASLPHDHEGALLWPRHDEEPVQSGGSQSPPDRQCFNVRTLAPLPRMISAGGLAACSGVASHQSIPPTGLRRFPSSRIAAHVEGETFVAYPPRYRPTDLFQPRSKGPFPLGGGPNISTYTIFQAASARIQKDHLRNRLSARGHTIICTPAIACSSPKEINVRS